MSGRLAALILLVGAGILIPWGSAFASSPSQPTTSSSSIGIRLVPLPGALVTDPPASSYVVDPLAPGTTLTRSVQIDNDTDAVVEVSVYPAAASIVRGNFAFAPSHTGNELSSWTSVSRAALRLAPGVEDLDMLTINVPLNASSGERYAVLWAGVSSRPTAAGGITLVNRVGVRMYVSIGPGGVFAPNFTIGLLNAKRSPAGQDLVVTHVHNSGQSTLNLSGNLMLSGGPDGLRAGPFAATLASLLLPGRSELVSVGFASDLPRGPWHADVTLTSGSLQRAATATISFPRNTGTNRAAPGVALPIPIIVASALAGLVIAALALFAVRRRYPSGRSRANQ